MGFEGSWSLDLKSTSETSLASQWASHPFSTANFAGTQWCPPSNKYVRTYREQWRQFEVLLSIFAEERRGFQLNDRRTQDCISDCSSLSLCHSHCTLCVLQFDVSEWASLILRWMIFCTGYSFWDRLRIFYTNLHELFCQFISWTNSVNYGKFWTIA